jgi:hypothetical protein
LWIVINEPGPLKNTLGILKYSAAARSSPRRRALDQAWISLTAEGLAALSVGAGAGVADEPPVGG